MIKKQQRWSLLPGKDSYNATRGKQSAKAAILWRWAISLNGPIRSAVRFSAA
jgi:hypothetical protein